LANLLKGLLETLESFWVRGEIANLSKPASGHRYFSLRDQTGTLRAVMYRAVGLRLRFELRDGQEVVRKSGRVSMCRGAICN
jgi:exodeoxyribonuclease VII large subunit